MGKNTAKEYDVIIKATITKTISVEAADENSATQLAHSLFSSDLDDNDENYEQDTVSVCEVDVKRTGKKLKM